MRSGTLQLLSAKNLMTCQSGKMYDPSGTPYLSGTPFSLGNLVSELSVPVRDGHTKKWTGVMVPMNKTSNKIGQNSLLVSKKSCQIHVGDKKNKDPG